MQETKLQYFSLNVTRVSQSIFFHVYNNITIYMYYIHTLRNKHYDVSYRNVLLSILNIFYEIIIYILLVNEHFDRIIAFLVVIEIYGNWIMHTHTPTITITGEFKKGTISRRK